MRRALLLSVLLAGCAVPPGKRAHVGARVRSAVVSVKDARGLGLELSRELLRRLGARGAAATALEAADSLAAGAAFGLESASDPRVLSELRSSTGADAVLFLTLDASWRSLELAAADARNGELLLRETLKPRGAEWSGPAEAAAAAARSLAPLWAERRKPRATRPDEPIDDIPVP